MARPPLPAPPLELSRIDALDVIARTSVMQYLDTEKTIPVEVRLEQAESWNPVWDMAAIHFLNYHQGAHRGDLEAQYQAMGRMVVLAPESGYLYDLARKANETNRYIEAVSLLERADPDRGWLRGWHLYRLFLARSRHGIGAFEGALDAAQEAASRVGSRA